MLNINKIILFLIVGLFVGCNEQVVDNTKNNTQTTTISKQDKQIVTKIIKKYQQPANQTINQDTNNTKNKTINSYPKHIIKRSSCTSKTAPKKMNFDIIKKGFENNNTLLIVGGIQGDEPGGFMAASLVATKYKILKGSVWIVPNFNFYSIIKRSRGPFGDLNRKFATISKDDPDYNLVQRMKKYIKDKHVSMIINLHDGSGYYRSKYIDKNHNPLKWGDTVVIDQESLPNVVRYKNIKQIADKISATINQKLLKKEHKYHVKNTHTRFKKTFEEKEMSKTLTYYAITHNKAAIGHETSKSLTTAQRVYYKLIAIESLMKQMGIEFKRDFNLNVPVVKNILDNDIEVVLYDGKIKLPLSKIRNFLHYFPIREDGRIDFIPSNPLISIIKTKNIYTIYYGNRRISRLKADYINYTDETKEVKFDIDNKQESIKFGSLFEVKKYFKIYPLDGYRVNVIGFTTDLKNETNIKIYHKNMIKRYSIDKNGQIYRIEFYKQNKFAGMILVKFIR